KRQRARAPMSCQLSSSGSWHSSSSSGGPHVFFDGWPAHGPLPGGATVVEDDSAASSLAGPVLWAGRRRGPAGSAAGLGAGGGRTAGRAHARAAAPHAAQAQAGAHRQAGDGVVPDGPEHLWVLRQLRAGPVGLPGRAAPAQKHRCRGSWRARGVACPLSSSERWGAARALGRPISQDLGGGKAQE
ncbi:unnamed protein product, partial [Prorocentrum cordatum]